MVLDFSLDQALHVPKAIVMPPQLASDSVGIPEYAATICVLQDHVTGLANDTCLAQSAQQER